MTSSMVEGPRDAWTRLAELILARRDELDLSRPQAVAAAGGKVSESTWGALERVEQDRYGRRKLIPICRALRWSDDSIEKFIAEGRLPVEIEPEEPSTDERLDRLESRLDEMAERVEALLMRLGVARNGEPPPRGV